MLRKLAQETVVAIRWNLGWAFVYNIVGIGFAAAGVLHPVLAAIAMGVSSLLVVSNSLRLAADESQASEPVLSATDAQLTPVTSSTAGASS